MPTYNGTSGDDQIEGDQYPSGSGRDQAAMS